MRVGTFLTLRAVCVFNSLLLLAFAVILAVFMQHPAGLVAGGICSIAAGLCVGGAQWLDRMYERGR
jgi:preprotein translocase subunit SecG